METIKILSGIFPFLEEKDIDLLLSISEERKVNVGTMLVKQGEINYNIYLVISGLLRSFVITSKGEERTILLAPEKMRAASFNTFLYNEPSEIYIEAIEPSHILIIKSQKFQKNVPGNPNLAILEKKGLQYFLGDAIKRLYSFTVLSPLERYIDLRNKSPELINRVPQKYLASYLGMTTVSLSRIKSKVAKENH